MTQFNTAGLLEPQKEHAKKLATSLFWNGVAADLSSTGTGKTFSASAIARHFDGPIVVVGPKLILRKWKEILNSFGKTPAVLINYELLVRGNTPWLKYPSKKQLASKASIDLNGMAIGRKFKPDEKAQRHFNAIIKFPAGALVIVDEGHRAKGVNSLNSGFVMALKRQGYKVLILSATMAMSPLDMRAFAYLCNLIPNPEMKVFKQFAEDAGAEYTGRYGSMVFDGETEKSRCKMAEIHDYLFNVTKIASRLTPEQMGTYFPENDLIAESYDMGPNSERISQAYDLMEAEIAKLDERTANYSAHIFAIIMAARRRIEMLKLPLLFEFAEDLYDEGKSVIVFLNFTDSIETLGHRLERLKKFRDKNLIGYIYGERSIIQRDKDIEDFQADRKRILLVNLACAESIGLHDLTGKYPRATLINPNFSPIRILQSVGRAFRAEGKSKVIQRFVYADGTIENRMCDRLNAKLNNLELLTAGELTGNINFLRFGAGKDV